MSEEGVRVAAVTGGTRGIGFGVARALVGAGWAVAVGSRSDEAVAAAGAALETEAPGRVFSRVLDVRDRRSCRAFVEETVRHFGRLDTLVNNAGAGRFESIRDLAHEDWDLQIRTNLDGVFHCSQAAIPHLEGNEEGGWIINIGSISSRTAIAGGAGYNASKFGLLGLTEAMMLDLRHQNIRVTIIMPGIVETPFLGSPPNPEESWKLRPEDVGRTILDLMRYPAHALPSRIEIRPTRPPRR